MFTKARGLTLVLVLGSLVAACGGDGEATPAPSTPTTTPATAAPATSTPAPTATATPSETSGDPASVGAAILATYERMLDDVTALLVGDPGIGELRVALADLKATYIEEYVALGWKRWSFTGADRSRVDAAAAILNINPARIQPLTDAVARFHALGTDEGIAMGNDIAAFNILSQYAFFEILRAQLPDEADRLGVP